MPLNLTTVNPGDLITARYVNELVGALQLLDARLTAVEGQSPSQAVAITERIPAGDIALPEQIELRGRGFVTPVSDNTVIVDGLPQNLVETSTAQRLVVNVPASGTLPRDGTITVVNRNGAASVSVRFSRELAQVDGELRITNVTQNLGAAQRGRTYTYRFEALSTVTEQFVPELRFSNASGGSAADWSAASRVEVVGGQVTLVARQPTVVLASVRVPDNASSVDMVLHLRSVSNPGGLSRSSGVVPIRVGRTADVSDPRVQFAMRPSPLPVMAFPEDPDARQIPRGQQGIVSVRATMTEAGEYRYSAEIDPPEAPFRIIGTPDPAQSTEGPISPRQEIGITVAANADASTETAHLIVHAHKVQGDREMFHSFRSIPIRGF